MSPAITKLTALVGADTADALLVALDEVRDEIEGDAAIAGFRAGLEVGLGRDYAALVFDDLTRNVGAPNTEFAREHGLTRAAVSKMLVKCRRNLRFPVAMPQNARSGAKIAKEPAPAPVLKPKGAKSTWMRNAEGWRREAAPTATPDLAKSTEESPK